MSSASIHETGGLPHELVARVPFTVLARFQVHDAEEAKI